MTRDSFRRRRRPPAVHRPVLPAPETPAEVLERAPDVSRETSAKDAEAAAWAVLGAAPDGVDQLLASCGAAPPAGDPPPLRKDQVARLEALTALWERQVRLEGPPDATLLYAASPPPPPPPPPARRPEEDPEHWERVDPGPPPVPEDTPPRRPEPVPAPVPAPAGPGRVSDWVSRHDPRSLDYAVRERLSTPVPLQDLVLEHGPILDQGTAPPLSLHDASACVGMAVAAAANVLEVGTVPPYTDRRHDVAWLREDDARRLYARAQDLDAISGADYAGTSVLAGMKAGQEAGYWDSYLWALKGTRDIAQALLQLLAPVVVGVPWCPSMESPDAAGIITPQGTPTAGHALAVIGLRLERAGRQGPWFVLQQSRGVAEGDGGLVYLHHSHLAQLLAGVGEAAVPLSRWRPAS